MMRRRVKVTALGLGLMTIPWMSSAQDRVGAPGATVEKLAGCVSREPMRRSDGAPPWTNWEDERC